MAEVARTFGDQELLARLVACKDQDEAFTLLTSAAHTS
jgi:mannitol/fructose-specific phosphotransferase system IIA component (Ntr-type)